jgi:colanic acid/amylovoran biosynthesis protein
LLFLLIVLPVFLVWAAFWRAARVSLPLPRRFRAVIDAYVEADLVIAAGGGYLYTTSALRGNVVLLTNLLCFFFGVAVGKPVVLYAQSIGPFASALQERLVRCLVAKVDLIEVREQHSLRLTERWRLTTPVRLVADAAFLLQSDPPPATLEMIFDEARLAVGMTVRRWFREPNRQAAYEAHMAGFVRWLAEERDAAVVLLPQVTYVEGRDDDRETAHRVVAGAGGHGSIRVVDDELTAGQIKWLCGRADAFVGTRMHSNIFALSSGVPTLAIAYQPKTSGIMTELGLERWVVPIEEIDETGLRRIFDQLVGCRAEIESALRRKREIMVHRAYEAGRLTAEVWQGWRRPSNGRGSSR